MRWPLISIWDWLWSLLRFLSATGSGMKIVNSVWTKTRNFFQDQGRRKFKPQEYIGVFRGLKFESDAEIGKNSGFRSGTNYFRQEVREIWGDYWHEGCGSYRQKGDSIIGSHPSPVRGWWKDHQQECPLFWNHASMDPMIHFLQNTWNRASGSFWNVIKVPRLTWFRPLYIL